VLNTTAKNLRDSIQATLQIFIFSAHHLLVNDDTVNHQQAHFTVLQHRIAIEP